MKTSKTLFASGLALALAMGTPAALLAAPAEGEVLVVTAPVPDEVVRYARYEMDKYAQEYYITDDPAQKAEAGELVSLGNGFVVYHKEDDGSLKSMDFYRFPVYDEGKILFLMDIGKVNGEWTSSATSGTNNTNFGLSAMENKTGTYVMTYGPDKYSDFAINKVGDSFKVEEDDITVSLFPASDERNIASYRLYNPNSGEHFYTQDLNERNTLAQLGWQREGAGWFSPLSGTAVFRLYNPNSGEHHYTTDTNERDTLARLGWKEEGTAFSSDEAKKVPVYRVFNPNTTDAGSHHYTTDKNEAETLIQAGWNDEGIGWYADLGGWQGAE